MEAQVMKTCRATNFHLSRINKIRRFLDFSSVKCVVNALVLSRLDYCNSLYLNLPSSLLNRLQRVQNAAVRTIFNLRKRIANLFVGLKSRTVLNSKLPVSPFAA